MKWILPTAEFVVEPLGDSVSGLPDAALGAETRSTLAQRYSAKLFAVRDGVRRLMWDIEVDDHTTAWQAMRADMQAQAAGKGIEINFDGLVDALQRELRLELNGAPRVSLPVRCWHLILSRVSSPDGSQSRLPWTPCAHRHPSIG